MAQAQEKTAETPTTDGKAETRSFTAEVSRVLHLMINALYTNRDIFLRELISNASDACDKLRYRARTEEGLLKEDTDLGIRISVNAQKRRITIADNGIGMNHDDLIENLGTIAKSGTREFVTALSGEREKDMALIGQFGVGFYSAFMIAEKVRVETHKAGEEESWVWSSEGTGEFTIEKSPKNFPRGTSVHLYLREGEDQYLDKFRLEHIIKTYSDHISFPIKFIEEESGEENVVNAGSAIWTRAKNDITETQYQEFYKHVAHLPDKPWMTLHGKMEGGLEYTYLLYIPSMRPFDLFHPDRERRVKLYVKRVFITEESLEIIPRHLRFLRGIVDSQDLPLNISRETLQHNRTLEKIQQSITKKVLAELKKKAAEDAKAYAEFWERFGAVLKEGLCEAITDKTPILELCRFYSSKSPDTLVSLDEYIARMPEGQDTLYYLTGDDVEVMRNSPQLEGFTKRGYEVLFFTDHVDTFWVNVVNQYKEKRMLSVTKANLPDTGKQQDDIEKTPEKLKEEAGIETLLTKLREAYGENVRDVRTTSKLTESPVCLAVGEGDMDIRMERFLVENRQLPKGSAKILEINPDHPVIRKLAEMAAEGANGGIGGGGSEQFKDTAFVLLDQARMVEGEEIHDPAAFARRVTALLKQGLGV